MINLIEAEDQSGYFYNVLSFYGADILNLPVMKVQRKKFCNLKEFVNYLT